MEGEEEVDIAGELAADDEGADAPIGESPSPEASSAAAGSLSLSHLQVERILRYRTLGSEIQYRIQWVGLRTETWASRAQLFWSGEEAMAKLTEFEEWATQHPGEGEHQDRPDQIMPDRDEAPAMPSTQRESEQKAAEPAVVSRSRKKGAIGNRKRGRTLSKGPASRRRRTSSAGPSRAKQHQLDDVQAYAPKKHARGVKKDVADSGDEVVSEIDSDEARELAAQGIYEVERLIGDVWESGVHWYRVKWRGYSDFDNSWQRPEDLDGCQEQLEDYWRRKRAARARLEEKDKAARKRNLEARKNAAMRMLPPLAPLAAVLYAPTVATPSAPITSFSRVQAIALPSSSSSAAAAASSVSATSGVAALPSFGSGGEVSLVPVTPAPSAPEAKVDEGEHLDEGEHFQLFSYPTLQAAQNALDEMPTLPQRSSSGLPAPAMPPAASDAAASIVDPADYGGHLSDDTDDDCSSQASSSSLLQHPAHKHAHSQPQCILAHDWYQCALDEPTWLMLVKWKNKPVAECSWEPRDALCLTRGAANKRLVTTYLKQVTQKDVRNAILKNISL